MNNETCQSLTLPKTNHWNFEKTVFGIQSFKIYRHFSLSKQFQSFIFWIFHFAFFIFEPVFHISFFICEHSCCLLAIVLQPQTSERSYWQRVWAPYLRARWAPWSQLDALPYGALVAIVTARRHTLGYAGRQSHGWAPYLGVAGRHGHIFLGP